MGANSSVGSEQDRDRVLRRVSPQLSHDEGQAIKKLFVSIAGGPERREYEEASLKASRSVCGTIGLDIDNSMVLLCTYILGIALTSSDPICLNTLCCFIL